jgi:hypothetical protein
MRDMTPEYKHQYNNGWKAGQRNGNWDQIRPEPWLDGMSDAINNRDKWHTPTCPDHDTNGCGTA